ncbi:TIGR04222 domain-containing membrane protein [Dactylosporangium sp. NBC_01737]|uniref:TIGR04222 domain-containing membrane protein n=1 Tax=Dactylosporangium sp. NBC_01737 TaxID=2975959 RepID=UPI002E1421C8|nr:TIGR04222 domain-containing membrane protein [Dactylosporangium sp. NBC_01737]
MEAMTGASNSLTAAGGPYVWIYAGLACCAVGALVWWRRHNYTRGPVVHDLNPLHLALLNGGAGQAVAASLGALRAAGAVRVVDGALRTDAVPHDLASELDLAVYRAVAGGHSPQSMSATDPGVRRLIGAAGRFLIGEGLMLGARERRLVREATVPVFAVALLGLTTSLVAFEAGNTGTGVSLIECAGVTVVAGLVLLRVDRLPARTRAFLARARAEAAFLAPSAEPVWAAHGPEVAGLGVALFGVESLHGIDPDVLALCAPSAGGPDTSEGSRATGGSDEVDRSMYSGGPTGPVHWYDAYGDRDVSWGAGDGGGGGSGGDGGGGGGDGGGGG